LFSITSGIFVESASFLQETKAVKKIRNVQGKVAIFFPDEWQFVFDMAICIKIKRKSMANIDIVSQ
jgi:hypothetical protein